MAELSDSSYLQSLKANLRSMFGDPIARLANISAQLESLQNRGDSILPSRDAAVFRPSVQPLIESANRSRELLMNAREQVEDIRFIQQEDSSE